MKIKDLSVFFPCVNEEGNIENTVTRAVKTLEELKLNYEIIVVNDGSSDNTALVIKKLAEENDKITIINHTVNLGYGEALKSGFYNAKYNTICYTDGDGQFDFSEVRKFLEKIENNNDVVVGYRIKRKDPFFRILFAKGWAMALFFFFRLNLKDIDCGFKMVKKTVLEKIDHLQSQRGAMINAELVIKAKKSGFRIAQVGVNHYPRLSGKPTGANIRVIFKSFIDLFKLWWKLKKEKGLFFLLFFLLFFSFVIRVYRIDEYMTFLGDEGRDALIIKDMVENRNIPFIGPPTSVGNIYLGPLYYYMMFLSMAPFDLNPVAAAVMNAILGTATVGLVYLLGKLLFNKQSGLISAILYSISPVNIIYSRTSWNPNPAPFFALINMLSLYALYKSGNFYWMILSGIALASAMQMHYLAVILIPITLILYCYELYSRKKKGKEITGLFNGTLLGIMAFCIIMFPLFLFDLKHNFLNYRAITALLSTSGTIGINLFQNIARLPDLYFYSLIGRYVTSENLYLTYPLGIVLIILLLRKKWPFVFLGVWLFTGLGFLSFYRQSIYDHYLGFLNPIPFLLVGSFFSFKKIAGNSTVEFILRFFIAFIVAILVYINLNKSPLFITPNNQLKRTQEIAKYVITASENHNFNFALLSKNNYDAAYQFYLDIYGHSPKQVPADITNQLFVVCEDSICTNPVYNSKYEIAGFGLSKVVWERQVYGVKLYKLEHNPSGEPPK